MTRPRPSAAAIKTPLLDVSSDAPDMQEAFRDARVRWPKLVAECKRQAVSDKSPPPSCFVKVPFDRGEAQEFMWLNVTDREGDSVFGILDNGPGTTSTVVSGDRIRKPVANICDWLLLDDPKVRGGFTLSVMRKIQERQHGENPDPFLRVRFRSEPSADLTDDRTND